MNKETVKKLGEPLLVAARILTAGVLFFAAVTNYGRLTSLDVRAVVVAAENLALAAGVVLGIYLLKSVLFVIPASLIYISVGLAFDTGQAIAINFVGIALEVTVTFLLGKFLGGAYVEKRLRGKKFADKLLNAKQKNTLSFLLVVRALPAFPIDFVSLFLGASGIGFLPYFILSVIGIMPRVILFTVLGDGIYKYIPMEWLLLVAISAIPAAVIVWLVSYIRKKRRPTVD